MVPYMTSHPRLALLALAMGLFPAGAARANEELYRKVAPATALIYRFAGPAARSNGTGFLIDEKERLLITARHVVENPEGGMVFSVEVIFAQTDDGEIITDVAHYRKNWQKLIVRGKVIYENVRRDIAIVQLEKLPAGIKPLELSPRIARPGQTVHMIGNSTESFGCVFSYCHGYVRNSFNWEELGARVVSTQLPINKGDSGGPMVDNLGKVVGFVFMGTTGGPIPKTSALHGFQVKGLCVCVSEVRQALAEMRSRLVAARDAVTGEAKASVHFVKMEKDTLYRILVKAKGFVPDVRIDNILVNPAVAPRRGPENEWQHLFTPTETKEYRIQVSQFPGRDVGKGPYHFSVDKVSFKPETTIKDPQLQLNEHVRKFEAGKVYDIIVKGKGFEPDLQVLDGSKSVLTRFNNGNRAKTGATQRFFEDLGLGTTEFETVLRFVSGRTADYRILVAVSPFSPKGSPLDYTLQIAEQKVHFSTSDQLTAKEPVYPKAGPFKVHTVKLESGRDYQIDLITSAFDSHVVLEDSAGTVLRHGLDAEGFNSRLFFRPIKSDTYRVVVTAHQIAARGAYTLTISDSPGLPGLPNSDKKNLKKGK
jgi:hypothetical protein